MRQIDSIKKLRLEKIEKYQNINFYPERVSKSVDISSITENFDKFLNKKKKVAGRIIAQRLHGGIVFFDILDETGKIQGVLKEDSIGQEKFQNFLDLFDVGDFIEVEGRLFFTQKKEKSINVEKFRILSKTLSPLPAKWYGLEDVEKRIRKRYLDFLIHPEEKNKFYLRGKIVQEIRNFLNKNGFLEVETPILQPIYGGASAEPFKTYHRALNSTFYLRIAPELYLKRLLVAGFEKVYEIGKVFRNEGIDAFHNPEFTSIEFYWAYHNFDDLMKLTEEMLGYVVKKVFGSFEIQYKDKKISFKPPFKKVEFFEFLKENLGKDFENISLEELKKIAKIYKINTKGKPQDKILDDLFKKTCTPKIIQPTFVTCQPIGLTPLAKTLEDRPHLAARFQLVVCGVELTNAFSELNSPLEQEKRFKEELENKKHGDKEAHPYDKDFIEALEYGMPPAAGFGMGIDRLCVLLTNSQNLREVILFPTLKPK